MRKKIYCFECNDDVEAKKIVKKNNYNVHGEKIEIEEKIYLCPKCHSELFDDDLDDTLYNIYNKYLNCFNLSFEKLKQIRNSYNLSQELFSKALGWSKRSVIRYENADSLPLKQYLLTYQKIKNDKYEFINILKNNRETLGDDLYYKIYDLINAELDLKTINAFLYILDDNYLTKTQIMKNMFSIDFQSYKENSKKITTLNYAHGTYGPVIDKKDAYLNILIKQNYLEMVSDEEDKILFKPVQKCDYTVFSEKEIEIMDKVKKQLKGKTANKLTSWSHKFKGWIETNDGEKIDLSYAKYFELTKNW